MGLATLVGMPVLTFSAISSDISAVSVAVNEFCFALSRQIARGTENVVISPLSLMTALSMAYAGAEGETAREMESVMYWGINREAGIAALGQLMRGQQKTLNRDGLIWNSSTRIWIQNDFPVLESYKRRIGETLHAPVGLCDFVRQPEAARGTINAWVSEATSGQISELLTPFSISPMTRMALINACHFKGAWAAAFLKDNTREESFWVNPGTRVPVAMMKRDGRYAYLRTAQTDILRLPYRGYRASMIVLLPRKLDGLSELEQVLTADQLAQWLGQLGEKLVRLELPRFEIEAQLDLAEVLVRMGMKRAFSDEADFSGITGGRELKVGQVIHHAKIKVDEEGAEAAAASGVMMQLTAVLPGRETAVFRADHPFVFLILDETTQTILFAGRVGRPPPP